MKFDHPTLNELYHGESEAAVRFQSRLLVFDILFLIFFMVSPFIERGTRFLVIDLVIAALLALDLAVRAWAYKGFGRWIARPIVWADFAVLISLVVPVYAANLGFLRILRAYSLINGKAFWRVVGGGRWADTQTAETVKAVANLAVFVFMMSALVHASFAARDPTINSFMESLYFTVTTLTTTGYGDIVLRGFWGRALSIIIMIGGVSLFFRPGAGHHAYRQGAP